jgi:hypothetical protein
MEREVCPNCGMRLPVAPEPGQVYSITVQLSATSDRLVLAGSLETHTRLRDAARDIALAAVNSPQAKYTIIEGGNHSLNNRRQEAAAAVLNWLASLSPQRVAA